MEVIDSKLVNSFINRVFRDKSKVKEIIKNDNSKFDFFYYEHDRVHIIKYNKEKNELSIKCADLEILKIFELNNKDIKKFRELESDVFCLALTLKINLFLLHHPDEDFRIKVNTQQTVHGKILCFYFTKKDNK